MSWLDDLLTGVRNVAFGGSALPTRETIVFEGTGVSVVDDSINKRTRVIVSPAPGGGSTPTGTGVRKVVGGVESAAASLVTNADIATGAAIAGAKLEAASESNAGTISAANFDKLYKMQSNAMYTIPSIGTQHNIDPGDADVIRCTAGGYTNIGGIVAPPSGVTRTYRILFVAGGFLLDESTGSGAANRILTAAATDKFYGVAYNATITYDHTSSRWRIIGYADG
jgi:hypothetical protein